MRLSYAASRERLTEGLERLRVFVETVARTAADA